MRAPHHGVGHGAPAVHEDAHLAARGMGELRQLPGELVGDEAIGGKLTAEQTLELANLGGPEALGMTEDPDRASLTGGLPETPI